MCPSTQLTHTLPLFRLNQSRRCNSFRPPPPPCPRDLVSYCRSLKLLHPDCPTSPTSSPLLHRPSSGPPSDDLSKFTLLLPDRIRLQSPLPDLLTRDLKVSPSSSTETMNLAFGALESRISLEVLEDQVEEGFAEGTF